MSNPSVVQYQCWNEGWGEPNGTVVQNFVAKVMAADPTRLVDDATGWYDYAVGLPATPKAPTCHHTSIQLGHVLDGQTLSGNAQVRPTHVQQK